MAGGNVACACGRSSQGERRISDDGQLGRRRIEQLLDLFQVINQGFADIYMGRGAIVIGLAAVIIGEVVFGKISRNFAFSLLTVALGSIIYYLVLQVVLWFGLNSNDLKLLSAIVVAVFLAIPYMKRKYFSKPVKKGGARRA